MFCFPVNPRNPNHIPVDPRHCPCNPQTVSTWFLINKTVTRNIKSDASLITRQCTLNSVLCFSSFNHNCPEVFPPSYLRSLYCNCLNKWMNEAYRQLWFYYIQTMWKNFERNTSSMHFLFHLISYGGELIISVYFYHKNGNNASCFIVPKHN